MNTSALILAVVTEGIILGVTLYCFYLVLRKPSSEEE